MNLLNKTTLSIIALSFIVFLVEAQQLPNIQEPNLHAPTNIKIDGNATEWKDQFKVYNKAIDASYIIANDKDKLYLMLQSADEFIIKKMMWKDVTFTISRIGKKTNNDNIVIRYPLIARKDRPYINFKNKPKLVAGNTASIASADSFMNLSNKRLAEKSKIIWVTGVKNLDTLISVYNTDGIKAASAFDNKMVYTYELAIDLKVLGFAPTSPEKFYYNIRLNSLSTEDIPGYIITTDPNGEITDINIDRTQMRSIETLSHTTDFWGEYVLAK